MRKNILKNFLEKKTGQTISDTEMEEIKRMVTDDIAFNFKSFGKKPKHKDTIAIAERCAIVLKRCL